jgi:hypothetical protein
MSENRTRVSQERHIPVEEPGEDAGKQSSELQGWEVGENRNNSLFSWTYSSTLLVNLTKC